MKLDDAVIAKYHIAGKVTSICVHKGHESDRCIDVMLTTNPRYTLKFVESDLEVVKDVR